MPDAQLASARKPRDTCHGYANGCHCAGCADREQIVSEHRQAGRSPYTPEGELVPVACSCDRPLLSDDGRCGKCGHQVLRR